MCIRDSYSITHRLHAIRHQRGLSHQASAESAALYSLGGTTTIEIDFVIPPLLTEFRALGKIIRLAATQLERHRMLFITEIKMT